MLDNEMFKKKWKGTVPTMMNVMYFDTIDRTEYWHTFMAECVVYRSCPFEDISTRLQ